MTQQQRAIKRKLAALRCAEECGNVALTARRFGISRQCFSIWKRAYEKNCRKRSIVSQAYGKQVPGHHIQFHP